MTAPAPKWMCVVLTLAGAYNLAWAGWAMLVPGHSFAQSGMMNPDKPLHYPQLWQGIGLFVGLFGVGYLIAARDPVRHWSVVFVGLLGKVFGPVGQAYAFATGQLSVVGLLLAIPNDLIWWVPFVLILRHAHRKNEGRT